MQKDKQLELNDQNETAYDDLMVSVEASSGVLSLLLAVCDDLRLREQVIQRYEAELQPRIRAYQIELPRQEPSLRHAIAQILEKDPYLQAGGKAVLTVKGAEQLSRVSIDGEPSEQDRFLGYLQWTREGFRAFSFPIILWLPYQLFATLSQKAPDFWSWRKDVFYFGPKDLGLESEIEIFDTKPVPEPLQLKGVYDADAMPLEELQNLIQRTEQQLGKNQSDPLLATLYEQMGRIYAGKIETDEQLDYETLDLNSDLTKAIESFSKAIKIQKSLNLNIDVAENMVWLGYLYAAKDDYKESEKFYKNALDLLKNSLGVDHLSVVNLQKNLAKFHYTKEHISESKTLFKESRETLKNSLDDSSPETAAVQEKFYPLPIPKIDIIGSPVTALTFDSQIEIMVDWANEHKSRFVCVANTHLLIEAQWRTDFAAVLQQADLVTPDRMPLVWMMKLLGIHNQDLVSGIDIFLALCKKAQEKAMSIYLVGSQSLILYRMKLRLEKDFPDLKIAGMQPLPFRPLTLEEDKALTQEINDSSANIVFVSLGCPKQEYWMAQHKGQINAIMIGLAGVFPVYAGIQRRAPLWVRESGLEWLYRLLQEPRRLWRRYVTTIPLFIWLALKQLICTRFQYHSETEISNASTKN
jgi:N-acetylglucosaminyldiphosphoundecaprenol N-acetyl-beta-D-mannosaminyltransferase